MAKKDEAEEVRKELEYCTSKKEVAKAASSLAKSQADKATEQEKKENEDVSRMIKSIEDSKKKMQAECDKAIESLTKMR